MNNTIISEINKIDNNEKRNYVLNGKGDLSIISKQKNARLDRARTIRDSDYEDLLNESKKRSRLAKKLSLKLKDNSTTNESKSLMEIIKKRASAKKSSGINKKAIAAAAASVTAIGAGSLYKRYKDNKKKDSVKDNILGEKKN